LLCRNTLQISLKYCGLWLVLDYEGRILEDEVLQPEDDDDESLEADELLLLLLKE
jgi:hypothetical protein